MLMESMELFLISFTNIRNCPGEGNDIFDRTLKVIVPGQGFPLALELNRLPLEEQRRVLDQIEAC